MPQHKTPPAAVTPTSPGRDTPRRATLQTPPPAPATPRAPPPSEPDVKPPAPAIGQRRSTRATSELKDVVIGGFNSTVNGVIETLDDTAKSAKEKLADVTNADVALNKTNDLVQKLKENFTQVDNISKELQTVKDVNLTKLEENIEEGRRAVENITQDISSITKSATEEVEKQINNGTRAEIVMQVDDSSKEITKLVNFSSARSKLTDQEDNVNDYGNYIYYAGLGLGCITLLIVLLYFLGLLFVICCSDEGSSCNQRTGTNFLMAGVGFTFIFVEFLMLLTMFLFIVGAPLYSVACRYTADLSDTARTEEFDKFLDALQVDLGHNLTISSVMAACGRNESLYNAAHLGDRIKIVEYLNISKYTALKDAIDELKNKTIDIGSVSILTNETKTMLDDLIGGSLESINFTSFTNQVDRNMTTGDLNNLIAQMQTTAGILKQDANDTAEKLQAQTNRLQEIQNSRVSALNKRKAELGEAIKELKVTLEENGGFTEDTNRLLDSLQNAEHNISAQGNSLLQNIVATLAEKMLKRISSELQDIGKKLTDKVGKCKKPLDIVQSTIDIGCISVLGPFNGLWFSLGWFIFFSIFGIIFAVKLVGVVRAVEDNGDNKSFEQVDPDAYYKGGGGGGRLDNNQWSAGRENHGYERTNSHSRDRHHRSSRNRREQHQRRQPRQPDYSSNRQPDYSSQRPPAYDSQQGYPQHYHNRGQW
ncbi:Prominin-1-A [Lamellibrachia satsuma]|nr:Prominin-1-A [Lamellibrachia satsuma]